MEKLATVQKIIKKRFLNTPMFSRATFIVLSIWILSLTVYYCINFPWLGFLIGRRSDMEQLIAEALKFHWVPVFLSRLPYIFYALILNFIALLIGNRILRWLKVDFSSNIDRIIFSIPLGWSIYSMGIFYLGISGLLYKEAVFCFLTLLGILSILELKNVVATLVVAQNGAGARPAPTFSPFRLFTSLPCKIDKTDMVFLFVVITFLAVQLVISFGPVWSPGPRVYHMALPKLYIKHHALVHIHGSFWSTLPAHTEMLYLLGLITSGETLSKLFSLSISSMFLISIFSIGNRYFSKGVGYLAGIIMMMQPSLFFPVFFSEPWTDVALGLFSLLGVYAFLLWLEDMSSNEAKERREGYLYLSVICWALAAATKTQGLFFVPLFFVGFFVTIKIDMHFLKKLTWCIIPILIIAMPWYIRTWWLTGNPVFPFFYNYLGGKYWNEYSNACFWEYHSLPGFGGAKSFPDFIRVNKDVFLSGFGMSSLSPIIIIFLIPALITLRKRNLSERVCSQSGKLIRYLFFVILVCYIPFIFISPQIRYFYVAPAILSIIVAHFIKMAWTKYLLTKIPIILCITIFSVAYFFIPVMGTEYRCFFAGLGVIDRKQFLNDLTYRVATWVNGNLPQDSKILSWNMEVYCFDREYIRVAPAFQGVPDLGRINDAPTFLKSIKKLGVTHLLYQPSEGWLQKRTKEFLDKCVSELLENGKIGLIKQIDRCTIYSVGAPPDYFVLDGNTIRFSDKSQRKYLVKGWSFTEEWGTWSEGKESVIIVNFAPTLPSPSKEEVIGGRKGYTMLIKAIGFSVSGKQQSVRIYLDDNLLGEHTFTHPTTYFEDIEVKIPSAYIKEGNQRIRLVYSFTGIPAEQGMSPDVRQLAMGVSSIEFK